VKFIKYLKQGVKMFELKQNNNSKKVTPMKINWELFVVSFLVLNVKTEKNAKRADYRGKRGPAPCLNQA
jgi:hypothetical protein